MQFFCGCIDSAGSQIKTGIPAKAQADFLGLRDWGKGNTDRQYPRNDQKFPHQQHKRISEKEGMEGTCLPPETSQPKTTERCQVTPEGAPAEKAKAEPGPAHSPGRRA